MPTVLDRRHALWSTRRAHLDRLAMLTQARATICACERCNDADRGEELDVLIRISLERVAYLSDRITDRSTP